MLKEVLNKFTGFFSHSLITLVAVLALSACAGGYDWPEDGGAAHPSSSPSLGVVSDTAQEYRLGSGDKLRVIVYDEPTLSGEFVVDGTGMVSMPLIGEIPAAGKTVRELQRSIETSLKEGYLNDPKVSAEVLNFRPFYILGEVNTPGTYPYTDGLTVLNAVATAGGFTYRANEKSVYIRRSGESREQQYPLTSTTPVRPGDTIRIGERIF